MTNFISDNTSLGADKTPFVLRPDVPATQKISNVDYNTLKAALIDVQAWLRGGPWLAMGVNAADPVPAGIARYLWFKNDATLWMTINGAATLVGGGGATGIGTIVNGVTNKLARYTAATTVDDAPNIEDDGTHVSLLDLTFPEVDLGLLGAGPLDLDLSSYSACVFKFTCPIGGTLIRSIKRKNNTGGQKLTLKNMSNSTLPADNLAILMQDDPGGVYQHIHLAGRQPWHAIPALEFCQLQMDHSTAKWHLEGPGYFQSGKWDLVITATVANATIASLAPVDDATGLDGRYVDHWRLITGASTAINGIAAPLPAGSRYERRLKITNYGTSSIPINYLAGAAGEGVATPGATAFTIRRNGSAELWYDGSNNLWYIDAA